MTKNAKTTLEQLEENTPIYKEQSLLETLEYPQLIDELEQHLIVNKAPYLLKTYDELTQYPELLFYLNLTGMHYKKKRVYYYFHLKGGD